jgi:uncharacterized protein YecT (DUF1311 family)
MIKHLTIPLGMLVLLLSVSFPAAGSNNVDELPRAESNFEYADNNLNITYKAIISKLRRVQGSDGMKRKNDLIESERAWIKYRDSYCKFLSASVSDTLEGRKIMYLKCCTDFADARVDELKSYNKGNRDTDKVVTLKRSESLAKKKNMIEKHIIHPEVFKMIQCWISDGYNPVLTELNLSALYNESLFDYDNLKFDGEWISYRERYMSFLKYKFIDQDKENNKYKVLYTNSFIGGTLTEVYKIEYEINSREIIIDDKPEKIDTLKVLSIKMVINK